MKRSAWFAFAFRSQPTTKWMQVGLLFAFFIPFVVFVLSIEVTADFSCFDRIALSRLWNSFLLAVLTSGLALILALAVFVGYLTQGKRGQTCFVVLSLIPLSYPVFGTTSAWMILTSMLEQGSRTRFLWSVEGWLSASLYSLPGCALILSFSFWPIIFLLLSMSSEPSRSQLDAARLSLTRWQRIRYLYWPAWRHPLVTGGALIFCLSLVQFEVPALLQVNVYPLDIYIRFSALMDEWSAMLLSIPYGVLALLMAWLLLGFRHLVFHGGQLASWNHHSIKTRGGLSCVCFTIFSMSILVPLIGLLLKTSSISILLTALGRYQPEVLWSLIYCASGAFLVVLVGIVLTSQRTKTSWLLVGTLLLLFVIPSVLTASAWLRLRSFWPGRLPYMIAFLTLLAAYLSHYLILGYGAGLLIWRAYGQRQQEFDTLLPIAFSTRVWRLYLPGMMRPAAQATTLIGVLIWGDFAMTKLLHPLGHSSLTVVYYDLLHYGADSATSAVGFLLLLIPAAVLVVVGLTGLTLSERS